MFSVRLFTVGFGIIQSQHEIDPIYIPNGLLLVVLVNLMALISKEKVVFF